MLLPFELDEYQGRCQRLGQSMAARCLDAALLLSGHNLAYFSGYPAPDLSAPRPFFLLLRSGEAPLFLVHAGREAETRAYGWVPEVRTYTTLTGLPPELPALLAEAGLARATIGCELGAEMHLNLPLSQFHDLQAGLPHALFADVSDLVWDLRMIKSPAEIACLRQACRITGEAYLATFGAVGAGSTQKDVARRMKVEMIQRGGADSFILLNSGAGTCDLTTGVPSDRRLAPGDLLWMDCGCSVAGYWSDFSRGATVGAPSASQREMHRRIDDLTSSCVDRIRPGLACADLARFCRRQLEQLPGPILCSISGLAGRVGHGVGLAVTEPPHIAEHEPRSLQQGMVVTVEPGVATEFGTFHFEANCAITADSCERLSTLSTEIFRI